MPRTYALPDFNLECQVWYGELGHDFATWPFTAPDIGDAVTIAAQLYSDAHDAVQAGQATTGGAGSPAIQVNSLELRVPKETATCLSTPHVILTRTFSVVYCGPDADGQFRFYWTIGEVVRHKGFDNEHKAWPLSLYLTLTADPYP